MIYSQSQSHGFFWENEIVKKVFNLEERKNDTYIYDIPAEKNSRNNNENVGIKVVGMNYICCGSIQNFINYDFNKKNTLIIIQYKQKGNLKKIYRIFEIDYNQECQKELFGSATLEDIIDYENKVKSIKHNISSTEAIKIFNYKEEKRKLQKNKNMKIIINPKIDRHSQRRVQCTIPNFETTLEKYITYKSPIDEPNIYKGIEITPELLSPPRKRGGASLEDLKKICKDNNIKKYSAKKKSEVMELLQQNIDTEKLNKLLSNLNI